MFFGENYLTLERWLSYYYQIKETMNVIKKVLAEANELHELKILEVGVGNRILYSFIKNWLTAENVKFKYTTVDIDPELKPDIVGDIRKIMLKEKVDVILAFQVLEHIPFQDVRSVMKKLKSCVIIMWLCQFLTYLYIFL
ncbi:MAG: class I SAM-dependent methyltransferase [candidate division WOR-3 bacterium]